MNQRYNTSLEFSLHNWRIMALTSMRLPAFFGNKFSFMEENVCRLCYRGYSQCLNPNIKNKKQRTVYTAIPCECGKKYIGDRGRPVNTRITEHTCNTKMEEIFKVQNSWTLMDWGPQYTMEYSRNHIQRRK